MKKKVIVLGKGELAIRIANWFFESDDYLLEFIIPVIPEPKWTLSLLEWANLKGIPIIESGRYNDIHNLKDENWRTDLAFSVFYDKIIKDWFINKCDRILNLHNGPLPKYRGVSPINWALKNEETMHGVTIHEITPGIDDGPIISQIQYSIYPEFDEVITVYKRALNYGWILFKETMPILDKIRARKQDESISTYYNKKQDIFLGERRYFTKKESEMSA